MSTLVVPDAPGAPLPPFRIQPAPLGPTTRPGADVPVTVPITHRFLPPRGRNFRDEQRQVDGTIRLWRLSTDEAPVAMRVHFDSGPDTGRAHSRWLERRMAQGQRPGEYRWWGGALWAPATADALEELADPVRLGKRLCIASWQWPTRDDAESKLRAFAERHVLIDDTLYARAAEPCYEVKQDDFYNRTDAPYRVWLDLSLDTDPCPVSERHFSALEFAEAEAFADAWALALAGEATEERDAPAVAAEVAAYRQLRPVARIEVLIPEAVRADFHPSVARPTAVEFHADVRLTTTGPMPVVQYGMRQGFRLSNGCFLVPTAAFLLIDPEAPTGLPQLVTLAEAEAVGLAAESEHQTLALARY